MSDSVETVTLEVGSKPSVIAPPPAADNPVFTGAPGNFHADLAALQAELNPQIVPPTPELKVIEPGQPTAPATPVPEKFQNQDGTANVENIEKSTVNAEQAYAKYAEIERQLRQKQNEVAALQKGAPIPVVPNAQPVQDLNLSPLEIQMAQDMINEAARLGQQLPQWQAIASARVMAKGLEAKYNAESNRLEQIGQKIEDQERRRELEKIAEVDPWVISPDGFEALSKIRQSRPHVNSADQPWTAAYREHLADQVMNQRLLGKVQPNPTGLTAKAPPTPVGPAPRVSVQPTAPDINSMSQDAITELVSGMTPAQETAFWTSRGLKFR